MPLDLSTPQATVARQFMTHKGLDVDPVDIEQLEGGRPCWYFLYELPEGDLELEVFYNEKSQEWETTVTTFRLAG